MTYYSTCKQLSFGRSNTGRPTTAHDTNMRRMRKEMAKKNTANSTQHPSHSRIQSAYKYSHLLMPKRSQSSVDIYNDKESYMRCVEGYFREEHIDSKKFKKIVKKIYKLMESEDKWMKYEYGNGFRNNGDEESEDESFKMEERVLELLGDLMEMLDGKRALKGGLSFVLPSCFTVLLHPDAVVVKVDFTFHKFLFF